LLLVFPGQIVLVQDPASKRCTKTGSIINFEKNNRDYIVKIGNAAHRQNRHFLRPQDGNASSRIRQQAQVPSRSVISPKSEPQAAACLINKPLISQPAQHKAVTLPLFSNKRKALKLVSQAFREYLHSKSSTPFPQS
jgi:hypothetical protein